jgi:catechol 2,3-dioxygenase-like lactoylglutathione lyase family enzyme
VVRTWHWLSAGAVGGEVRVNIEKISAVTLKVASMTNSVRFYRDVLGMEIIYGGEDDCFLIPHERGKGPHPQFGTGSFRD